MSSRVDVLSGKPRVRRVPRSVSNEADDFCFLAASYGLSPDDWQEDALDSWLGRRADGRWSAATAGLAVPRQNGKNGAIEVRELGGMVALGEKFLHTAHEVKTARKAFLRISSFFENERQFPELAVLVADIRKTNGQEAVILRNGGSVEFIARSRGSGRGFTVDVLVCDEAQELTNEELEALLPTISAAPTGNPQVILTGTPPKPGVERPQGEVFRALRTSGEKNLDARLAWTDFGVADGPCPDITNRHLWFQVNPALGGRLQVAEVERELALMTDNPEGFARERLGWWGDPAATDAAFPFGAWVGCADPLSTFSGQPVLAVSMNPDRTLVTLAAAGRRDDDLIHVEVVRHGEPSDAFLTDVIDIARRQNALLVLHPMHAVGAWQTELENAKLRLHLMTGTEYQQACGAFFDGVVANRARYLPPQPELDQAVSRASRKASGEAWRWAGKGITALVAVTQAYLIASTQRRAFWGSYA